MTFRDNSPDRLNENELTKDEKLVIEAVAAVLPPHVAYLSSIAYQLRPGTSSLKKRASHGELRAVLNTLVARGWLISHRPSFASFYALSDMARAAHTQPPNLPTAPQVIGAGIDKHEL
jgi:hypothetical protein